MGSFNDLPKDVVWLIFRFAIRELVFKSFFYWESVNLEVGQRAKAQRITFGSFFGERVCRFAYVSKRSLKLFSEKCVRIDSGFLFISKSIA